jgi:hypothetical protein
VHRGGDAAMGLVIWMSLALLAMLALTLAPE